VVGCEVQSLPRRRTCGIRSTPPTPPSAAPQNQANCTRPKICAVGCEVVREKLGLCAKPATPNNAGHPLHASNSATAAPQNQLHLANCTLQNAPAQKFARWAAMC